jgi:ElaB/YqjD/DUF883 family membrane-anchored ribosome-binding protein
MTTTTNAMGSGCEVESATFHAPVGLGSGIDSGTSGRSGFRGKLDDLKSRGMSKVSDVKSSLSSANVSLRNNVSGQVDRVQSSMKTNPMLWAGVAAGSGFALGLLGRFIHWRNNHRHHGPELVIIEAGC